MPAKDCLPKGGTSQGLRIRILTTIYLRSLCAILNCINIVLSNLTMTLHGKCCYPHFRDEETEAQKCHLLLSSGTKMCLLVQLQNPHSKHLLPQLQVASIVKESIPLFTSSLIKLAFLSSETRCKFFSLTKTPEDYSIIVDEEGFLELPSSEHVGVADATWLALNVVSRTGSFSSFQPTGMTEIVKSTTAPLANQNISVSMLSTYQMDFILVHE